MMKYLAFLLLLILVLVEFRQLKKQRDFSKKLVLQQYPELTKQERLFRSQKIVNYKSSYSAENAVDLRRNGFIIIAILVFAGLAMGLVFTNSLVGNFIISTFLLSASAIAIYSAFIRNPKRILEDKAFWLKYLNENPENALKVVLLPDKQIEKKLATQRRLAIFLLLLSLCSIWVIIS